MNLLNVILSVCVTGIMSYFSILNISKLQIKKSDFLIYNTFFIPLVILNCFLGDDKVNPNYYFYNNGTILICFQKRYFKFRILYFSLWIIGLHKWNNYICYFCINI